MRSLLKRACALLLFCFGGELVAQPYQLKDINPSGSSMSSFSYPLGNSLLFTADDGTHGFELWKTDGTASGTVLVKDIFVGSTGSSPQFLGARGSEVYFVANHPAYGFELWKSNGTTAGTVLVSDLFGGPTGSNPTGGATLEDYFYFTASNGLSGRELWRTNGTDVTELVVDLRPGISSSSAYGMIAYNDSIFFAASQNSGSNYELWKTNGTAVGTVLVRDIRPGLSGSLPNHFAVQLGKLVFTADNGTNGRELWISDGSTVGTMMIKDINLGGVASDVTGDRVEMAGYLYFSASDGSTGNELWRTDGTGPGTQRVADIYAGTNGSSPVEFRVLNNQVYFIADSPSMGYELWKTDGSGAGTQVVLDLNPGLASGLSNLNSEPVVAGSYLYFVADDGSTGYELWRSDGTTGGTTAMGQINTSGNCNCQALTVAGGDLYLSASNGIDGDELFVLEEVGDVVTGLSFFGGSSQVNPYQALPNPFADHLTVDDKGAVLTLHDQLGTPVARASGFEGLRTEHLPAGLYLLQVEGARGHSTLRVVKP